ncbi:hypothetical protein BI364_15005 [Acidihalobacter yilgarnensis]|uniref:Uncharacterized protein n=1 Tax=Acidihalobacter yilgarnensis TaxID=2819280 RepID=A0A1D8IRQ2_9GAMM|nr:hypothetical protein [Acidihalobacter yilgarnensis]AOU99075.1 hypothetical protein BI364_15005 [Acidihalobacter yilgarnensis]
MKLNDHDHGDLVAIMRNKRAAMLIWSVYLEGDLHTQDPKLLELDKSKREDLQALLKCPGWFEVFGDGKRFKVSSAVRSEIGHNLQERVPGDLSEQEVIDQVILPLGQNYESWLSQDIVDRFSSQWSPAVSRFAR